MRAQRTWSIFVWSRKEVHQTYDYWKEFFFAVRFTACLTWREKEGHVSPCRVKGWFLRLTLFYTESWMKDWQDYPLHLMRILTLEIEGFKQIEVWSSTVFTSASYCWMRVIPEATPLLKAKLSGVNHLLNSSLQLSRRLFCHRCHFKASLPLMGQPCDMSWDLTKKHGWLWSVITYT